MFNSDIKNNYIQYGQTLKSLKSITGDLTDKSALLALTVQNLTPKQQALALATKGVNQAQIAEILSLNGIEEKPMAMRGGTDGSFISTKGIFVPNYFTGASNFHSTSEFWPLEDGEASLKVTLSLMTQKL